MKVYIAGPMTGYPDWNYRAFFDAADQMRAAGYEPINPARAEGRAGCKSWLDFMRAALRDLAEADGVALLDGWGNSRGAAAEARIAQDLGSRSALLGDWLTTTQATDESEK